MDNNEIASSSNDRQNISHKNIIGIMPLILSIIAIILSMFATSRTSSIGSNIAGNNEKKPRIVAMQTKNSNIINENGIRKKKMPQKNVSRNFAQNNNHNSFGRYSRCMMQNSQSGYGNQQRRFGNQQCQLGNRQRRFRNQQCQLGNRQRRFGNQQCQLGNRQRRFENQQSGRNFVRANFNNGNTQKNTTTNNIPTFNRRNVNTENSEQKDLIEEKSTVSDEQNITE